MFLSFDPDSHDIEVPDPWYGTQQDFAEVFDMVEVACEHLLEHLEAQVSG